MEELMVKIKNEEEFVKKCSSINKINCNVIMICKSLVVISCICFCVVMIGTILKYSESNVSGSLEELVENIKKYYIIELIFGFIVHAIEYSVLEIIYNINWMSFMNNKIVKAERKENENSKNKNT